MKLSTERILTTHVGSLPRPKSLLDVILAKEEGRPVDAAAFEAQSDAAVAEVVAKQVTAGVDIVSDGEMRCKMLRRAQIHTQLVRNQTQNS